MALVNTGFGPSSIVRADYCQNDTRYPVFSRGKQCMANSLLFLVHCCINQVKGFDKRNLHFVLDCGDCLYRYLRKDHEFLLATDLPSCIQITSKSERNYYMKTKLIKSVAGIMAPGYKSVVGLSLENAINTALALSKSKSVLVVFHLSTVGILRENGVFYVFDPHSRGPDSLCHASGSCVMSILPSFTHLCSFLRILCKSLSSSNLMSVQFEVHSFHVLSYLSRPKTANILNLTEYRALSMKHLKKEFSCSGMTKVVCQKDAPLPFFADSGASVVSKGSELSSRIKRKSNSLTFSKNLQKCDDLQSDQPARKKSRMQSSSNETRVIEEFQKKVSEGLVYTCTCCSQVWFQSSVLQVRQQKCLQNDFGKSLLHGIKSEKNCEWICKSCLNNITQRKVPQYALSNGMGFPRKPKQLDITEMEERLICPRIPFMQIYEKPRGGQRSLRGNVVNVPTDVTTTMRSLPRTLADSETIQVKLKRKLNYKHCVKYEAVRPNKCLDALRWLLDNSILFQSEGIELNDNWQLLKHDEWFGTKSHSSVQEQNSDETIAGLINKNNHTHSDDNEQRETTDVNMDTEINKCLAGNEEKNGHSTESKYTDYQTDLLDNDSDGWTEDRNFEDRLTGNTDTLLHPVDVRGLQKVFSYAPGEGQVPLGLYQDVNSEYLAFPSIYCGQKRPDNKDRKTPVHYSSICKWELRSSDRRAACSIPNLFFKLKKLQIKQLQDKVTLALRKCKGQQKKLTAGEVLDKEAFNNMVKLDEGYRILRTLRGSPSYWEHTKKDVFAMIRQLGIPTWFCSFSAAETRWSSLLKILGKLLKKEDFDDDDLKSLTWMDKCQLIKSDPVTCARYFNHRVNVLLETVLKGKAAPLGTIKDFFYRVEFQQRGSPHIHMLVWIENAPIYGKDNNADIENFIDQHITCSRDLDRPDLINYQTHRHARTCRKRGKAICRFGFPLLPMPETKVLEPLTDEERDNNSSAAANYINICELLSTMTMGAEISFSDFLKQLEMNYEQYIFAVRSSLNAPKIFLKRKPSDVRVNSYNTLLLKSWEANIDVQYIVEGYGCAAYVVSYISKGQRGMSNLLYEACNEARKGNLDLKQQIRHIGNKFLTHVEICAQEAAYLVLQMPLRMATRQVVFVNTSQPSDRVFLLKPLKVLEDMPTNSLDIESDNCLKRYTRRPSELNRCCLADYVAFFDTFFPPKKQENVNIQESMLPENDVDLDDEEHSWSNDVSESNFDQDITPDAEYRGNTYKNEYICRDGSVLRRRKKPKVLRYVRYNKEHDSENYFREQIMLFLPWRNEVHDLIKHFTTYEASYHFHHEIIKNNSRCFEGFGSDTFSYVENHLSGNDDDFVVAPESQHMNEEDALDSDKVSPLHGCFMPDKNQETYDLALDIGITRKQVDVGESIVNLLTNDDYLQLARKLNCKQRTFFYHVLHWFKTSEEPLYCFLTGGAGVGKSVLTTALYQAVVRFFTKKISNSIDNTKAVLCAPTGKAAHNIGGHTIHSLFCIPANQGFKYKPLDAQQLDSLRVKLQSLKVVFIDEISMVGNKMFNYINMRLQEIFANGIPFGGVSIIAIGDLYQLKPVMDGWIFHNMNEDYGPLALNLWTENFKMFELDEIMRQKDDREFAELLNRLREGLQTSEDIEKLKKSMVTDRSAVAKRPHLYTTNIEVNKHNIAAYMNVSEYSKCTVPAIDTVNGDILGSVKEKILKMVPNDPAKTMGLSEELYLAENLPAEVCINIDVEDGLTNGTHGIVKKLDFRVQNSLRCSIVWMLFSHTDIGAKTRMQYRHFYVDGISMSWIPILEVTRKFSVGRSKSCSVTRRQFPLKLAAAKTIHKSQGSTMDTVVLHFGTRQQEHIHYVGLSRVRKLSDVHILHLNEKKIAISKEVSNEMNRLRSCSLLQACIPLLTNIQSDLKIVYHNTRSLHLHHKDLAADSNLLSSDILVISESRLYKRDLDDCFNIPNFDMYRIDEETDSTYRPFKGMVIYSKVNLQNIKPMTLYQVEAVSATIYHCEKQCNLCFIYNPPKNSVQKFMNLIEFVVTTNDNQSPLLIVGDTNIDAERQSDILSTIQQRYGLLQIMHSITTDYGTCLDHVYIKNVPKVSCATLESHYSDHKPIVTYLPF